MVLGQEISVWFVPDLEERLRALFFFLCTMSRCFPFPPPGYEKKKLSPDDAHTLLKEKPKEKKEKKDRKERSEEKRREKKEKKRKDKKDKKEKDKKRSDSEKVLETSEHQNGIQSTQSEPQFLVELEKRFKHDDGATQSKTIATNNGSEKFKENHIEAKEKFMDKRMVNGQTLTVEVKDAIFPVEKIDEKPKEKKKHRRSSDGGIGETREDKKRKKEKKKEEKSKEQINHTLDIHGSNDGGNGNHGKRKFTQSNGVLHDKDNLLAPKFPRSISMEMENGSKYNSSQVITVHNAQVNGTKLEQKITLNNHKVHTGILLTQPVQGPKRLLESSETPNKLTTNLELEVSSSLLVVKNGLKSDIQTALDLDKTVKHVNDSLKKTEETKQSELKVGTSSQPNIQTNMVDNKTHMVNGVIKKHKSKKVKEKPPHPDSKYLNEILTVPSQLEWSEFDDQEWLFSNNGKSKSTKVEEETKQVWSEALLLESEDIIALPYVIPY